MIIIGVSVFFFSALCFSSCGDSSEAGGIVGIILGFKQGILEFTGIFGEYLDSSYSDYCPMIIWKDKK